MILNSKEDFRNMMEVMADRAEELGLKNSTEFLRGAAWHVAADAEVVPWAEQVLNHEYRDAIRSLVSGAFDDLINQNVEPWEAEDFMQEYLGDSIQNDIQDYGFAREVAFKSGHFDARGSERHAPFIELVEEAYRKDVWEQVSYFLRHAGMDTPEEWLEDQVEGEDEDEDEDDD